MSGLSVDTDIPAGTDLFGKSVTDLQTGIEVGSDAITGTLNDITGYTAFTGDEQNGHFIAIHCDVPNATGVTLTVEVVGGFHGPVTLDEDGIAVLRIANTSQSIRVTASKAGYATYSKTYELTGITLA